MTVSNHQILLVDAIKGMADLADKSVDLIVTDPAYDSLEQWRAMGTTTRLKESKMSSNKWFPTVDTAYYQPFFKECFRVLKNNSYIFVMCDERTSHVVTREMLMTGIADDRIGFGYWRKCGKPDGPPCSACGHQKRKPGTPGMGYPMRSSVEKIVLAKKGKPKPPEDKSVRNDLGQYWLEEPHLKGKFYPTEKPVPLVEIMIRLAELAPGSMVLDPFAGSGSTGEAAFNLGHRFLGFDVAQDALDYFEARKVRWVAPDGSQVYVPAPADDPSVLDFFS